MKKNYSMVRGAGSITAAHIWYAYRNNIRITERAEAGGI